MLIEFTQNTYTVNRVSNHDETVIKRHGRLPKKLNSAKKRGRPPKEKKDINTVVKDVEGRPSKKRLACRKRSNQTMTFYGCLRFYVD